MAVQSAVIRRVSDSGILAIRTGLPDSLSLAPEISDDPTVRYGS